MLPAGSRNAATTNKTKPKNAPRLPGSPVDRVGPPRGPVCSGKSKDSPCVDKCDSRVGKKRLLEGACLPGEANRIGKGGKSLRSEVNTKVLPCLHQDAAPESNRTSELNRRAQIAPAEVGKPGQAGGRDISRHAKCPEAGILVARIEEAPAGRGWLPGEAIVTARAASPAVESRTDSRINRREHIVLSTQIITIVTLKLQTKKDLASEKNVSVRCIENWMNKQIIPFLKVGSVVRFDPTAVDAALSKYTRRARGDR